MPGPNPSNARAISLILALSVVAGSWLAFEYSNRSASPASPAKPLPEVARPAEPSPQIAPQSPIGIDTQAPRNSNLTYRCQKNGQTSFSDQPCGSEAKVVSVTAAQHHDYNPDDRLTQMKRAAAKMEAERLARDRVLNAEIAARTTEPQPSNAALCKFIDDQIANIDAKLRQPHDAQTGDALTGERKKFTDRRFDLRC